LRHLPGLLADVSGLGEESGHQADVELGLALPSHGEEELPAFLEGVVQVFDEPQRLGGEQFRCRSRVEEFVGHFSLAVVKSSVCSDAVDSVYASCPKLQALLT